MAMRAAEQAALPIPRMAVGEAGGLAEHRDAAALGPAQDAVMGQVADQQAILVGEPDRALEPGVAFTQHDQRRIRQHQMLEQGIEFDEAVHG